MSSDQAEGLPSGDTTAAGPAPSDPAPVDGTLKGYLDLHRRPPAFEGSDGHPYTVSIEIEPAPDLRNPFRGYLVFPRWATTGVGVVGHVETPVLVQGATRSVVEEGLGDLELLRLKMLLEEAIAARASDNPT